MWLATLTHTHQQVGLTSTGEKQRHPDMCTSVGAWHLVVILEACRPAWAPRLLGSIQS